jgi:hypothetical protein
MTVSNCDKVELILNGRSLGVRDNDPCEQNEWSVPFEAGKISAVGYRNGVAVAHAEQNTAGAPVAVRLIPDRTQIGNGGQDTVPVRVSVVDAQGVEVPTASHLIRFSVEGDGIVAGVGNGDPNSHEPDHANERHAFCGWCQALVTADIGAKSLKLRAFADGLAEASFDFAIENVPAPITPKPVTNYILEGFTMSEVSAEKLDATAEIADNDMNSFTPIQFVKDVFQTDFRDGWRIYRTKPKAMKDGEYRLDFLRARFHYGEIYVDGKLVDKIENGVRGGYVSAPFRVKVGETHDIRILLHVENESPVGAGISGRVEMKETK